MYLYKRLTKSHSFCVMDNNHHCKSGQTQLLLIPVSIQQYVSASEAINIRICIQFRGVCDLITLMMAKQAETCWWIKNGLHNCCIWLNWLWFLLYKLRYIIQSSNSTILPPKDFKTPERYSSTRLRFEGLRSSINRYRFSACRNNLANESVLAIRATHRTRNHD